MDIDDDALQNAGANCAQFEDLHVDFVHADVTCLPPRLRADTVVTCVHAVACYCAPPDTTPRLRRGSAVSCACCALTHRPCCASNPPFGTQRKGADAQFLQAAAAVARNTVYSLHKARAGCVDRDARACD